MSQYVIDPGTSLGAELLRNAPVSRTQEGNVYSRMLGARPLKTITGTAITKRATGGLQPITGQVLDTGSGGGGMVSIADKSGGGKVVDTATNVGMRTMPGGGKAGSGTEKTIATFKEACASASGSYVGNNTCKMADGTCFHETKGVIDCASGDSKNEGGKTGGGAILPLAAAAAALLFLR